MKEVKELRSHPGRARPVEMRACASGVARTRNLNKRTKKASIRINTWNGFQPGNAERASRRRILLPLAFRVF
jgi:hypothetical protein